MLAMVGTPLEDRSATEGGCLDDTPTYHFAKVQFLQTDLPQIQEVVRAETWIWAKDARYASDTIPLDDNVIVEEEAQDEQ